MWLAARKNFARQQKVDEATQMLLQQKKIYQSALELKIFLMGENAVAAKQLFQGKKCIDFGFHRQKTNPAKTAEVRELKGLGLSKEHYRAVYHGKDADTKAKKLPTKMLPSGQN